MNLYEVKGTMSIEVTVCVEAEDEREAIERAENAAPFAEPFTDPAIGVIGVNLAAEVDDRCHNIQFNPDDFITYDNVRSVGPAPEKQYD